MQTAPMRAFLFRLLWIGSALLALSLAAERAHGASAPSGPGAAPAIGPLAGALLLGAAVAAMVAFLRRRRPDAGEAPTFAGVQASAPRGGLLTAESVRVAGAAAALFAAGLLLAAGLLWRERDRAHRLALEAAPGAPAALLASGPDLSPRQPSAF